jgi:hypothetical protein
MMDDVFPLSDPPEGAIDPSPEKPADAVKFVTRQQICIPVGDDQPVSPPSIPLFANRMTGLPLIMFVL